MTRFLAAIFTVLASVSPVAQSPTNLVLNPSGEHGATEWQAQGSARVEEFEGNRCFVVRNGGKFLQTIDLPRSAAGKFVLFVAHVSSERAAADVTDRPYLYGLTFSADRKQIVLHNQMSTMSGGANSSNQWAKAWGVFRIPEDVSFISYQLRQGLRRGIPHTGAPARFDDVGLFVFDARADAEAFVSRYR